MLSTLAFVIWQTYKIPYDMIETIVLLGAGNVASNLGKAFLKAGKEIVQVYSRTQDSASCLAGKLGCPYTTRIESLYPGADLYIISVTDTAIDEIIKKIPFTDILLAHTSGSVDIKALKKNNIRPAVIYPLQTFSKDVEVDFEDVPLFLEAGNEKDLELLESLAGLLSSKVSSIDSKQRMVLHIAAVFACNFTNHMFYIAEDLLKQNKMEFQTLKPLINETIRKALLVGPFKAQTGPAVRNDKFILKLHDEMLSAFGDYRKFYNFITDSIIAKHAGLR